MTEDLWLGRHDADPETDKETWCLVKAGDALLSRRAAALPGQDLMRTVMWGEQMSSTRAGRFVRHADLAASLVPDGSKASKQAAARLAAAGHMDLIDRCGVALAGNPTAAPILIAAVLAAAVGVPNLVALWGLAAQRVIATGAHPALVHRHRTVAEELSGSAPTPEQVAESLCGGTSAAA